MKDPSLYIIGIATRDITPPIGTPLAGFAKRGHHSSIGIDHPLRVVVMSLGDDHDDVLLISAELLFFEAIADRVRQELHQQTGVPPSRIVLCGTHTHCGPAMRPGDVERHGWIDEDYLAHLSTVITQAAIHARSNRQPATLSWGLGFCDFAVSRRAPDPDHPSRVLWGPAPEEPADHDVPILVVRSLDGIIRGVLFSYACHPTSRSGLRISGDYPGFAYDRIEKAFNMAQPCFLQGCGADQKPKPETPHATVFSQRDLDGVRALGHQLGDTVIETIQADQLVPIKGPLSIRQATLKLQTEPVNWERVDEELRKAAAGQAATTMTRWAQHHHERRQEGQPEQRTVPLEIQTLCLGMSLAMIFIGAEAVVEYALGFKATYRQTFDLVMPIAYANDVLGYCPVKRQLPRGGYEVLDNNLMRKRTGAWAVDTEERIREAVEQLLSEQKTEP